MTTLSSVTGSESDKFTGDELGTYLPTLVVFGTTHKKSIQLVVSTTRTGKGATLNAKGHQMEDAFAKSSKYFMHIIMDKCIPNLLVTGIPTTLTEFLEPKK